ncbi:RagB/SusD family nutrient uptake outer membrane protein [Reichenbachiella ulvae]|uniref:RagB/SusD family nutrient uptake outer membrane protein n=1 Tax=Reichenbachiella ulvae TaxID=2980104 RepID=A0ABT3CSI5_9BACT|nr:RagB/SusD family nutrient uptake outer membrane protein [Reichenbachiella ulvae]MCV9386528.1 RagB/SusD family nutrient uptake outer membrane protein [Reichenbachiella ulvae]
MKKLAYIFLAIFVVACTDLDLKPEEADVDAVVFQDPASYRSYLAKIYAAYTLTGQQGPAGRPDITIVNDEGFTSYIRAYWKAQELTTDEAVIAWSDAGIRDLHYQTWSSNNQFMQVLYYRVYYIIAYANDFLTQSTPSKLSEYGISAADQAVIEEYRAEARYLRALAYWHALDMFRNIPLITSISTDLPSQATPLEVFEFIETELNEVEPQLPDPMSNEYGRVDKGAVWMLQAKLYLNAEVYINESRYDEVITACNKVFGGGYSLHNTYAELWMTDNDELANSEIIFALAHDGDKIQTWGGTTFLVHAAIGGSMDPALYGVGGGWAGTRTTYGMVEKFGDTLDIANMDPRNFFYTAGQTAGINDVATFEDGYAVAKWVNISSTGEAGVDPDFVDTDYPVFRLADAYLMYAEATLRGGANGDMNTALGYINMIRERAYGDTSGNITIGEMDLDFILDERVRELHWEGTRRVDLIRYGQFSDQGVWPWKGGVKEGVVTSSHLDVFPIPASDLNVNPNLKQNEGY